MSAIQPSEEESQPTRENFWGQEEPPESPSGHTELAGTPWEEHVAHAILRHGADMLCPLCIEEDDRATVISDPQEYIPKEVETSFGTLELHVLRHRRRVCPHPDCGYISFGGILADRETDEFLTLVEEVLAAVDLPPKQEKKLYNDARARKYTRNLSDEQIVRKLVTELGRPQSSAEEC